MTPLPTNMEHQKGMIWGYMLFFFFFWGGGGRFRERCLQPGSQYFRCIQLCTKMGNMA